MSKAKFQKECKKEEVEEEEEEEDDEEDEEEEQAVSVADMFSSEFGKEENDSGSVKHHLVTSLTIFCSADL